MTQHNFIFDDDRGENYHNEIEQNMFIMCPIHNVIFDNYCGEN